MWFWKQLCLFSFQLSFSLCASVLGCIPSLQLRSVNHKEQRLDRGAYRSSTRFGYRQKSHRELQGTLFGFVSMVLLSAVSTVKEPSSVWLCQKGHTKRNQYLTGFSRETGKPLWTQTTEPFYRSANTHGPNTQVSHWLHMGGNANSLRTADWLKQKIMIFFIFISPRFHFIVFQDVHSWHS